MLPRHGNYGRVRRGKWVLVVLILLSAAAGLVIFFGRSAIDLPVPEPIDRLLPGHDGAPGTEEETAAEPEEEAADDLEAGSTAETPQAGERVSLEVAQVRDLLQGMAQERQVAYEAIATLRGQVDEAPPNIDQQLLVDAVASLRNLGDHLGDAQSQIDALEEEIDGLPSTPRMSDGARSIPSVLWAILAVAGWFGWCVYYLRSRRRKLSERDRDRPDDRSLETRLKNIERHLEGSREQRQGRTEDSGRWIEQLNQQIDTLGNEISGVRSGLGKVLSRLEESGGRRQHASQRPDAGSHGGSWNDPPASRIGTASAAPPVPRGRFHGPIREIRTQLPSSAEDMEFAPTHDLLVPKQGSVGKKFKVFRDKENQTYRVVPLVDSAYHRDQLAWLQKVFDVEWNGNGEVKLLSDPTLESTSEGFKVRSKGRLSVG